MPVRRQPLVAVREINEIIMTPLIDLSFLLLITFIITIPLLEQGIAVNLPRAAAADLKDPKARTISMDAGGRIFLDEIPTTLEQLAMELKSIASTSEKPTVLVRADQDLKYAEVVRVLKLLYDAKIARVAIVTQAGK